MMGRQHALAAAATWLAAHPVVDRMLDLTPAQSITGLAITTGAGMLLDLDQRGSTIARTYGPVTNVIARGVGTAAGGHRRGTHCLLAIPVFSAVGYAASTHWIASAAAVWLLLGVAVRAMGMTDADGPGKVHGPRWWRHLVGAFTNAAIMAVVTLGTILAGIDTGEILAPCIALGTASHLFTDCLTVKGCPLFLPFSNRIVRIPLFTTSRKPKGRFPRFRRFVSGPGVTTALSVLVVGLAMARVG